jgi:hypothetical protein
MRLFDPLPRQGAGGDVTNLRGAQGWTSGGHGWDLGVTCGNAVWSPWGAHLDHNGETDRWPRLIWTSRDGRRAGLGRYEGHPGQRNGSGQIREGSSLC